jgi:hypothetical protein
MNYLPEELNYILFTYLEPIEIYNLSKTLKVYVDYSKLISFEYPKTFKYLKNHLNDDDYKMFKELREIKFNDDFELVERNICTLIMHYIYKHKYIYNIMAEIIVKISYNFDQMFDQFPKYKYKYLGILYMFYIVTKCESKIYTINLIKNNLSKSESEDILDYEQLCEDIDNQHISNNIIIIAYILFKFKILLVKNPKQKLYIKLSQLANRSKHTEVVLNIVFDPIEIYNLMILDFILN